MSAKREMFLEYHNMTIRMDHYVKLIEKQA